MGPTMDLQNRRRLTADWFSRLAIESGTDLSQRGTNGESFTFGGSDTLRVTANPVAIHPYLSFSCSDPTREAWITELVVQAATRVAAQDFGGEVWYSTGVEESAWSVASAQFIGTLILRLGTQQRIEGWRRLGSSILLEFVEESVAGGGEAPQLLAPKAQVRIHIAVPGPCEGHFSSYVAHGVLETVGAICTFALGRPVTLPPAVFQSIESEVAGLQLRRADPAILTLARKTVPLDIFGWLGWSGGYQVFHRLRAALLTADAAVKQDHDSVASILYVVAAESLTVPPADWRNHSLTKRFINFYEEMIPDELDQIVNHANFEETFGIKRGSRTSRALRRATLAQTYSYRSGLLHEGLDRTYFGFGLAHGAPMRRALLADLFEAAVLAYIRAPRSSVIGHPLLRDDEGVAASR